VAAFLALCLLSRLAYAVNDVLVGRLARRHGHVELAALRGLSLGLTMSPLLAFVPSAAWGALLARWPSYLVTIAATAGCNVLQNRAARFLPFGLRAAVMISTISIASVVLGTTLFAERLSPGTVLLCAVLVGSAVAAALGTHTAHEIRPEIPKGAALALGAGLLLAVAAALTKRLATETHPMLTAWAWELGAGAILLAPLAWQWRRGFPSGLARRFRETAIAASPTVVGSGASIAALGLGALGAWGALAGTQVLFTAWLGVAWHREAMGARRWLCFLTAAAAVAGLALGGP
jgi:drug/metabolite transporter (DMT)-like permease